DCDGDSPPSAQRGRRGLRAVWQGAEGQLGDAAQAQPGPDRTRLRAGARGARPPRYRTREHRALARARHQPFLGREDHLSRRLRRRRLHGAGDGQGPPRPRGAARANVAQPAVRRRCRVLAARAARPRGQRDVARGRLSCRPEVGDGGHGRGRTRLPRDVGEGQRGDESDRAADEGDLRPLDGPRAHRPRLRATWIGGEGQVIAGPAVVKTDLPLKLFARGKVRDTYELDDDKLLMVATDRISAFDHVLPNGIPDRGKVLTQLSIFWFSQTDFFQENHLVSGMVPDLPAELRDRRGELGGRFMIVRKAKRIDFECVVRGYIAGSAWKEYQESQTLAGEKMPPGLRQSERLAIPIFSPATKAETGHDENITFADMKKELGDELATKLKDASMELYKFAAELSARRGLILADTKFEF